jgi:hypothetical protein
MNIDLAELELFFGDANAAETRIYARLPLAGDAAGLSLSGTLTGPYCLYAATLPATIPLVDQGPGESLLAQAIVPDPCCWSPELPMLYNARVELRRGAEVLQRSERTLGIRPLGARGRRLIYEGKSWVLRGVSRGVVPQAPLEAWHEADTAMLIRQPDDNLCQQASRLGVLLVAEVGGDASQIAAELRRLSRWAAVGLAIVETTEPLTKEIRALARNLLLVQPASDSTSQPAPWAHAWLLDEPSAALAGAAPSPCLVRASAERRLTIADSSDFAAARRQCDALQRDLAAQAQFAGYLL